MDLYFAGGCKGKEIKNYVIKNNIPRLFSYYSDKKEIKEYIDNGFNNIFLDSGAFSVYNSGKSIDINDFINYINDNGDNFKIIASLDVIGNEEESYKNYLTIRDRIKYPDKLLPTWHIGESLKSLDIYISDSRVKYLGIGGIALDKSHNKELKIRNIVEYIRAKNKDIKLHLFGVTNLNILNGIDITSIDSTTWIKRTIYASIIDPVSGKAHYLGRRDIDNYDINFLNDKTKSILKDLNISFEELRDNDEYKSLFNLIAMNNYKNNINSKREIKKKKLL